MSLTIKICKNTIILSNKAFSSLKETYLSFRDYLNLRHRCPLRLLASDCRDYINLPHGTPSRFETHLLQSTPKPIKTDSRHSLK